MSKMMGDSTQRCQSPTCGKAVLASDPEPFCDERCKMDYLESELSERAVAYSRERDDQKQEIERLSKELHHANSRMENCERDLYLRINGLEEEIERLKGELAKRPAVNVSEDGVSARTPRPSMPPVISQNKQTVNGSTSDGYHTFDELYEHRITLYIALCRNLFPKLGGNIYRTRLHSDGSSIEGWFILGIFSQRGQQITYHLPDSRWDETNFCEYTTRTRAPEFDGHTSADVLERLKRL